MKCITLMSVIVLGLFTIAAYAGDNEKDDSSFVQHEYWQCDPENISALQEAIETMHAPIFDDLVAEGKFLGWGKLTPTGAVKYDSPDEATPEEIERATSCSLGSKARAPRRLKRRGRNSASV